METTWETDVMRNCKDDHQMDLREIVCKWSGFVTFGTGSREGYCEHGNKTSDLHKKRKLARPTQP